MIAVEQFLVIVEFINGTVIETVCLEGADAECPEYRLVRDFTDRQNCSQLRHGCDLVAEEIGAFTLLVSLWFVFRRHTTHPVCDPAIDQAEIVVGLPAIGSGGEFAPDQRRIEDAARIVDSKWTSGAIGAAKSRRQANNEESRPEVTKRWNRRIIPIGMAHPVVLPQ